MKKKVSVVIGLNYGDEGKGLVTDFLANQSGQSTAVVRFNGGAQAGHTVELPNGQRHIFHHFGAGSFCGASTILSKFFVVNPILMFKEADEWYHLSLEGKLPPFNIYVDDDCEITTPYDVYINQALEHSRGDQRHGSCGVGFGETLERESRGISLKVKDIGSGCFLDKLERIRNEWFPSRLSELGLPYEPCNLPIEAHSAFVFNTKQFLKVVNVLPTEKAMRKFDNLIFEGAQGLRLDQGSNDFPNVTRSNTGLKNVMSLLNGLPSDITVYYVTRTYMTRHGAGPLLNEIDMGDRVIDKTNVPNKFQGTMRYALLDYQSIAKNVQKEKDFLTKTTFSIVGVVTCCDQVEADIVPSIIEDLSHALGTNKIITSWGPTRDNIISTLWVEEKCPIML